MKLIDVSTPKHPNTFTMVDDEDYEHLNQWKWSATNQNRPSRKTLYAERKSISAGVQTGWVMHRYLMKTPKGMFTDHIDGDGLNNQRSNLRVCTRSQNQQNAGPKVGGRSETRIKTSKYKGVCWNKRRGKYEVQIDNNGSHIWVGLFIIEDEAAQAYNDAALKYHGEFAKLNVIPTAESK